MIFGPTFMGYGVLIFSKLPDATKRMIEQDFGKILKVYATKTGSVQGRVPPTALRERIPSKSSQYPNMRASDRGCSHMFAQIGCCAHARPIPRGNFDPGGHCRFSSATAQSVQRGFEGACSLRGRLRSMSCGRQGHPHWRSESSGVSQRGAEGCWACETPTSRRGSLHSCFIEGIVLNPPVLPGFPIIDRFCWVFIQEFGWVFNMPFFSTRPF